MINLGWRESVARFIYRGTQQVKEDAIIVPLYKSAIGEYQVENIRDAIDAYLHDTDIYNAVNFICNSALSDGFYVTGDEKYKSGKAIDVVKEFNDTIRWGDGRSEKRLAPLLRIVTHELVYGGNTFIEMLTPDKLEMLNQVQLSSIYRIFRSPQGSVNRIQQLIGGRFNDLDPQNIIHVSWLQIDREPFGRGLIQPLIAPRMDIKGRQVPPFYKIKASLEYDLYRMVHRRGVPRSVFSFPEAGDELVQAYSKELQDPDVDASFATNTKIEIASEVGGPAQGVPAIINWLSDRYHVGLQTPINALITASGFTQASAIVAQELGELVVEDLQLRLKYAIEDDLYDRILIQNGFDPKLAKIEFHWGASNDYEYNINDIHMSFDRNLLSVIEARQMLRKVGLELDDDSKYFEEIEKKNTATTMKGQQVVVAPGDEPQVEASLQPTTYAKSQGLSPGQVAQVPPPAQVAPAQAPKAAPTAPAQTAPAQAQVQPPKPAQKKEPSK